MLCGVVAAAPNALFIQQLSPNAVAAHTVCSCCTTYYVLLLLLQHLLCVVVARPTVCCCFSTYCRLCDVVAAPNVCCCYFSTYNVSDSREDLMMVDSEAKFEDMEGPESRDDSR